ncbi:MAG: hypothetical protein CW716_07430 [Candidatus Bathyarchaeum sp.]|nr:MAG: hypothetical protein CW716_07430 [Candidatus Bathyarchaeum sp.]
MHSFVLAVQGVTTIFSALFISVYLLGLRDLPETVVYHAEPTFRTALSVFGVLSIILIALALILSFVVAKKE